MLRLVYRVSRELGVSRGAWTAVGGLSDQTPTMPACLGLSRIAVARPCAAGPMVVWLLLHRLIL